MGRLKETQKYLDGWGKKHGPVVARGEFSLRELDG
jgi:hypothetical protein